MKRRYDNVGLKLLLWSEDSNFELCIVQDQAEEFPPSGIGLSKRRTYLTLLDLNFRKKDYLNVVLKRLI